MVGARAMRIKNSQMTFRGREETYARSETRRGEIVITGKKKIDERIIPVPMLLITRKEAGETISAKLFGGKGRFLHPMCYSIRRATRLSAFVSLTFVSRSRREFSRDPTSRRCCHFEKKKNLGASNITSILSLSRGGRSLVAEM